jgi:hypothetical protein
MANMYMKKYSTSIQGNENQNQDEILLYYT